MPTLENLAVALDERFSDGARANAAERVEAAGCALEERESLDDRTLAWIDLAFGGTWSREAFAAYNVVARRNGAPVGFASFAPRDLRFRWLRSMGAQRGVGIFGPFGVAEFERGGNIAPALLTLAFCGLRRLGYATALIAAVGDPRLAAYYARQYGARVVERFNTDDWSEPKLRTVVMASGAGTNFAALARAVADRALPIELAAVVSSSDDAGVRERARDTGIAERVIAWQRQRETRAQYDERLLEGVRALSPQLLLLLGWMHLLDVRFVAAFPAILNLHPAFLPLDPRSDSVGMPDGTTIPVFRGPRAVRDAIRAHSGWIGASVHRVREETDRGPIVMRAPLQLKPGENEDSAYARLREVEHALVPRALRAWCFER